MLVALSRYQEALSIAAASYPEFACDQEPEVSRGTLFPAINVSLALEKTGERACAMRLLDRTLQQMRSMPRAGFFGYGFSDVEVYARQGRTEQALTTLRKAIDDGWRVFWWTQAERSPQTTSLRDEPAFQAMMAEIRSDMTSQLQHLRDMDARGELAPVPRMRAD